MMKSRFKNIFKRIGIILLALVILSGAAIWYFHQPLPTGIQGPEADKLAKRMLQAVKKEAWDQTNLVSWTYTGHQYLWDKKRNLLSVKWADKNALLNLSNWQKGKAFIDGQEQTGNQLDQIRGKAWTYFCNDAYWLIAPTKVFDEGTERRLVKQNDGSLALLVTYRSGGVTPGDSYLWFLDKEGLPTRFQMWVSIIPVGGIEASWEKWVTLKSGARIATEHQIGPIKLSVTDLRAGDEYGDSGFETDPFQRVSTQPPHANNPSTN